VFNQKINKNKEKLKSLDASLKSHSHKKIATTKLGYGLHQSQKK
jgi:hypothetical protein